MVCVVSAASSLLRATAAVLLVLYVVSKKPTHATTRFRLDYVRPKNLCRDYIGGINLLAILDLYSHPQGDTDWTNMRCKTFIRLLRLVSPFMPRSIYKRHRLPIGNAMRLMLTLNYLKHGTPIPVLARFACIAPCTARRIIHETNAAIWAALKIHTRMPQSPEEWRREAILFEHYFDLRCLGAVDGRHVQIRKPRKGGSAFWCYKQFHSLNLMACSSADLRCLWFSIEGIGSQSDSSVFQRSKLGRRLEFGRIELPPPEPFEHDTTQTKMPFFFVGDGIFTLADFMLVPFSPKKVIMTMAKWILNMRISRARNRVENLFAILNNKWAVLEKKLGFNIKKSQNVVKATIALHNWLIEVDKEHYFRNIDEHADYPFRTTNCPKNKAAHKRMRHIPASAKKERMCMLRWGPKHRRGHMLRDAVMRYVNGDGAVDWQVDYVNGVQ